MSIIWKVLAAWAKDSAPKIIEGVLIVVLAAGIGFVVRDRLAIGKTLTSHGTRIERAEKTLESAVSERDLELHTVQIRDEIRDMREAVIRCQVALSRGRDCEF